MCEYDRCSLIFLLSQSVSVGGLAVFGASVMMMQRGALKPYSISCNYTKIVGRFSSLAGGVYDKSDISRAMH